jgi:hypothetical protein
MLAPRVAKEILNRSVGDAYLQATALRVLHRTRPKEALEYMRGHVQESPAVLISKMMELLAEPGEDERPPSEGESAVARLIVKRLRNGSTEDSPIRSDVAEMFSARFRTD